MHWELIPIIVIAVWILSNLLRNKDEDNRAKSARPGQPSPGRQRGGVAEIDRFLEEIQRRRRQSLEERREEAIPEAAPVVPPRSQPEPPRVRRPARPVPPTQVVSRKPLREETTDNLPEVIPVAEAAAPPPPAAQVWPSPGHLPVANAFPVPSAPPAPPTNVGGKQRRLSPAVAQVLDLLRKPQAMQTAIILREVLDVPRCRRRQR